MKEDGGTYSKTGGRRRAEMDILWKAKTPSWEDPEGIPLTKATQKALRRGSPPSRTSVMPLGYRLWRMIGETIIEESSLISMDDWTP